MERRWFGAQVGVAAALLLIAAVTPAPPASAQTEPAVVIPASGGPFFVGEWVELCYTLSAPAPVLITHHFSDGSVIEVFNDFDPDAGRCTVMQLPPPAGYQCIRVEMFTESRDRTIAAGEACFDTLE